MGKEKLTRVDADDKKEELEKLIQYLEGICQNKKFDKSYIRGDLEKNLILGRLDIDQLGYYLSQCADILRHVALDYCNDKSAEKALEVYYKATSIYQMFDRILDDELVTEWGQILYIIGDLHFENGEPEKTFMAYQLSNSLHEINNKVMNGDYSKFWSSTFLRVGDSYVFGKLYGKALEAYSIGLKVLFEIDKDYSDLSMNVSYVLMQIEHLGESINKLDEKYEETDAIGGGALIENYRLREIARRLNDDVQRQQLIKQALSSGDEESDEFNSIVNTIIRYAYRAGLDQSGTSISPAKVQSNIDTDNHVKLLTPFVEEIKQSGITTLQGIADALNEKGIYTKNDKPWYASTVKPLLKRIASISQEEGVSLSIDDHTQKLIPVLEEIRREGINTMQGIAESLNERGLKTRAGGLWHAKTVKPLLHRIEHIEKLHNLQNPTLNTR